MTIEVRQLLIKSQVNTEPSPALPHTLTDEVREQVKGEILAECKSWLTQQLQDHRER